VFKKKFWVDRVAKAVECKTGALSSNPSTTKEIFFSKDRYQVTGEQKPKKRFFPGGR
jgi:hypothetical protein